MDTLSAADVSQTEISRLAESLAALEEDSALGIMIHTLLQRISEGTDVVMGAAEDLITPAQASRLLGMSRPHLYKLLDDGLLAFTMVGTHRRMKLVDVLAFRSRRDAASRQLAETFAHAERNRQALVARLAGVDSDRARRLGY